MRQKALTWALLIATGCAGAAPSARSPVDAQARAETERVEALEETEREHQRRIRELEAQLAMARTESSELREEMSELASGTPPQAVTLGAQRPPVGEWTEPGEELPEEPQGARPVLRLYGESSFTVPLEPAPVLEVPQAPPGIPSRLPVVPLVGGRRMPAPITPTTVAIAPPTMPRRAEAVDRGGNQYRAALTLVRERRFAEALDGLSGFIASNPGHAYLPNAVYWRAEMHYAMRSYSRALAEFEHVVARFPRARKVSDALLKIGLCHLRMGDAARARSYFRRVRRDYPDSVAAQLASQEDAS